jgi:RNA 2',3'-cyclic 3'-phosphodiesterase
MATRGDRLFVAVPLPAAARDQLTQQLPPDLPGRRVAVDKWHFTLRFLGATAPSLRDRLIAGLGAEDLGSVFDFRLAGLGAFPKAADARVLWLGVAEGSERFRQLAALVNAACTDAGLESDERPYAPHLTLSRFDPPRDLRELLHGNASVSVEATAAEVLVLRSHFVQGPPRYETLARYTLTSAA